jgi:hypothetical protein
MTADNDADEHDHEWTYCVGCLHVGKPCPCSGGACPECPIPPEETQ